MGKRLIKGAAALSSVLALATVPSSATTEIGTLGAIFSLMWPVFSLLDRYDVSRAHNRWLCIAQEEMAMRRCGESLEMVFMKIEDRFLEDPLWKKLLESVTGED